MEKSEYEQFLTTAAGKIRCLRCMAKSTRSKLQCRKPALKLSRTQKCEFHGGRPHSNITLLKIASANTLNGKATKSSKKQFRDCSILLHELEDALYVLNLADGPRTRGRKPVGYRGILTEEDVIRMIKERFLHRM